MKKIEMLFYKTVPSEKNAGLKYVLWEVTDPAGGIAHDWGFCEWDGLDWIGVDTPEGFNAKVVYWANTIDPQILLKEQSKIISLPGVGQ